MIHQHDNSFAQARIDLSRVGQIETETSPRAHREDGIEFGACASCRLSLVHVLNQHQTAKSVPDFRRFDDVCVHDDRQLAINRRLQLLHDILFRVALERRRCVDRHMIELLQIERRQLAHERGKFRFAQRRQLDGRRRTQAQCIQSRSEVAFGKASCRESYGPRHSKDPVLAHEIANAIVIVIELYIEPVLKLVAHVPQFCEERIGV